MSNTTKYTTFLAPIPGIAQFNRICAFVNLGCGAFSVIVTAALFFHPRSKQHPFRVTLLFLANVCMVWASAQSAAFSYTLCQIQLPVLGTFIQYDNAYFPSTFNAQLIASAIPQRSYSLLLSFLVSWCTVRLLYRPDLPRQTKVYRTIAITIYTIWATVASIGVAALFAWIYVQSQGINQTASLTIGLYSDVKSLNVAYRLLNFIYFLFVAIFSGVITWDKRFDMRAVVLFQFALVCFYGAYAYGGIGGTTFSYSLGENIPANRYRYQASRDSNDFNFEISGFIANVGVWLLLGCFFRDFARRTPRVIVPGWRERAFDFHSGDSESDKKLEEGPDDVERAEMDTKDATINEAQAREVAEANGDSKVAGELLGCPRAELHARHEEVPVELPGDVEIAELPAGKDAEDAAYVKATKGYDAEVIHTAVERAQNEADGTDSSAAPTTNFDFKDTQLAILGTRSYSYE